MSNEHTVQVTFDLNKFLSAYDKPEFVAKVFKEFMKENPKIVANHLKDIIFNEVIKSGQVQSIVDAVKKSIDEKINEPLFSGSYEVKTALNSGINKAVEANKSKIENILRQQITTDQFSEHIKNIVTSKVQSLVVDSFKGNYRYED